MAYRGYPMRAANWSAIFASFAGKMAFKGERWRTIRHEKRGFC